MGVSLGKIKSLAAKFRRNLFFFDEYTEWLRKTKERRYYRPYEVKVGSSFAVPREKVSPCPTRKRSRSSLPGEKNDDPFKVIAMLGGTCLKKMQELTEVARDNKLGSTLILCPYYFRPESVKELIAFCKK
ncbi:MAG: hypothetical protein ACJAX1_002815 [Neolewinella sp.]